MGLQVTSGLTGFSPNAAAASSETSPAIAVHVVNYAGVAPKILAEAEEVTTGIFRNAGIETRWADIVLPAENSQVNSAEQPALTLADIELSIFPRAMSDRLGLPDNVVGLAPGSGLHRTMVYVFDSKVDILYWRILSAYRNGHLDRPVSKAQILGHVIAHEVGHLLLKLRAHSKQGIMSGDCGLIEMRDAAYEMLFFTSQQAEVLRADVRGRNARQESFRVAELESRPSAQ